MRAQVQYVPAADGTILAYADQGDGIPCVYLTPLPSHLERIWEIDAMRVFFEWLSTRARLVRIDYRGSGLSQRGISACSVENFADDLDRVLAHLGIGPVALLGWGPSTLTASRFAHRFVARVLENPQAMAAIANFLGLSVSPRR